MPENRIVTSKGLREHGAALILGVLGMLFVIPMAGLSIDVAVLYNVRAQLQGSVDGAALAAARVLNIGQTTSAQADNAKQNAVNWFYSNFPGGRWGTTGTVLGTTNVSVWEDTSSAPHVRNVTVTATTSAPTYFMKWFGVEGVTVRAEGNASRRDVVVMMVLDISGSMGTRCADMRAAAKLFTGQFAANRDLVGLVSFNHAIANLVAPTTNFQTTLGYSNSTGSGTGVIDTMPCGTGGTGTAQAISIAWNELYKLSYAGALNVILFETDGLPNSLTLNFWDSANTVAGIASGSPCKDTANKTKSAGGFGSVGRLPNWTTPPSLGTGSYFSLPSGITIETYAADPSQTPHFLDSGTTYWGASATYTTTAPGCYFNSYSTVADFAWFPSTDIYGNELNPATNPYKSVTMSSGRVTTNTGHTETDWTNLHNASLNAADDAAHNARASSSLPAYFFGIALGGNTTDLDLTLMQRMANDPNGDLFSGTNAYAACADNSHCVNYPNEPKGTLVYSTNSSVLSRGFLTISSQILRLSK